MGAKKTILMVLGGIAAVGCIGGGGGAIWAKSTADAKLAQKFDTHQIELQVPFPLTDAELNELRAQRSAVLAKKAEEQRKVAEAKAAEDAQAANEGEGAAAGGGDAEEADADGSAAAKAAEPAPDPLEGLDLEKIALDRALERGKHLVTARFACIECHGKDFGGGTMMDGMPVARLFGPNLTLGEGSVVKDYTVADWDRIVRHGVKPDGTPAVMPSEDFVEMSDQELSDIIAYIRAQPPVDRPSRPLEFGPVGIALMALGKLHISAEMHPDHQRKHKPLPPPAAPNPEFGKHLTNLCTGCHRADFRGGPIAAGDPAWVPAANLTPHEQGLAGWTYDDFVKAMRESTSKDGRKLQMPMTLLAPYAQNMTETELQAMWAYLQTVAPHPTGE